MDGWDWHHWGWDPGAHMGWMVFWWLLGLVALIVLVWAVVAALGRGQLGARGEPRELPEEIVRERYARGEIDRETYERMLTDLGRRPPSSGEARSS